MSSTRFEPKCSSSERRWYVQVWMVQCVLRAEITIKQNEPQSA